MSRAPATRLVQLDPRPVSILLRVPVDSGVAPGTHLVSVAMRARLAIILPVVLLANRAQLEASRNLLAQSYVSNVKRVSLRHQVASSVLNALLMKYLQRKKMDVKLVKRATMLAVVNV